MNTAELYDWDLNFYSNKSDIYMGGVQFADTFLDIYYRPGRQSGSLGYAILIGGKDESPHIVGLDVQTEDLPTAVAQLRIVNYLMQLAYLAQVNEVTRIENESRLPMPF